MLDRLRLVPFMALAFPAGTALAQDVEVRLSVKFVLDAQGQPPSGTLGTAPGVLAHVDEINDQAMARFGRGYGFRFVELVDVAGYPQYYELDDSAEMNDLIARAPVEPGLLWNGAAVNVYVVDGAPSAFGGDPLILFGDMLPTTWLHELGHHYGLWHTFDDDNGQGDHVADTQPDPDPLVCTQSFGCALGGTLECCCATKIAQLDAASAGWTQQQYDDIYFNVMSYYGASDCSPAHDYTNVRLTPGQLDRWTDTSRLSFAHEVSGVTYFVDPGGGLFAAGYSFAPVSAVAAGVLLAEPGGGDIVFVRSGSYPEQLTISKPLVLRAPPGGSAVIGR